MPKIAWAKKIYNAYNNIKENDKVYNDNGELIGNATTIKLRCTYKNPGSVHLDTGLWISGDVEKNNDGWKLCENCKIN